MSEVTSEDYEQTIRNLNRQIEILTYEANILRAQKEALHRVLVEALQGKRPPPAPPSGFPPDPEEKDLDP